MTKLPDTVSPVVAAAVGALKIPVLVKVPTATLLVPLVKVLPAPFTEKAPLTLMSWVSVTAADELMLTARLVRAPEAGISRPVVIDVPV